MASVPVTAPAKAEDATATAPASSAVNSDADRTDTGGTDSLDEVFDSQFGFEEEVSEEEEAEDEGDEDESDEDGDDEDEDAEEEEAEEEESKLPLEGCEIEFCGSFGRNYPREVLWDMVKELKGGDARTWILDPGGDGGIHAALTHVVASRAAYNQAYGDVVLAETDHGGLGRAHIVQVDWLKDCYARKRRMDERAYYFREAPTIMSANYILGGWRIRPYQHLLSHEELRRRLDATKETRGGWWL
ncbi:hypothetical protein GE09DRAFT_1224431 [Coniochaeta sp. 2T2.1]|nr:hypothetical protein GE09DRAFT_1224431 [Coniochaeta sp. 2T2.1]